MSVSSSEIANWTIGKFTNDGLEAAAKVCFKNEDETDDGIPIGPIWLELRAEDEATGKRTGEVTGHERAPSWYPVTAAHALADELGVPCEVF